MRQLWGPFLSDTVVVFGLGSAVNLLNYLFVVFAARSLSPEVFGRASALLACVTISLVLGNSLQLRVTQTVAEGRAGVLPRYVGIITRRLALVGVLLGLIILLAAAPIGAALHASFAEIALTGCTIVGVLFFGYANGLTSGLRRLKAQAWIGFVSTVVKLVFLLSLLQLGWGSLGVLSAYAVGVWLVVPLSFLLLRGSSAPSQRPDIGAAHCGEGMTVFSVYLLITTPFMLDQILVQSLAQPLSGLYGALATLGKLIFYGCAPIMTVVFPYLAAYKHDPRAQLRYAALGGTVTIGGAILIASVVAGQSNLFTRLFFSSEYAAIAPLVGTFAFAVVLYVAAYVLTLVCLVRGNRAILLPLSLGVFTQLVLFWNRSDSLASLANNQLLSYGILLGALALFGVPELIRMGRGEAAPAPRSVEPQKQPGGRTLVYLHPHFTLAGGAGKYVLETGSRFAAQGYNVVVISIRADEAIVGPYRRAITFVDIGGPLSNSFVFWVLFPFSVGRVIRALKSYPEAILFAQVFPANWWGFAAKIYDPSRPLIWMCQEPSAFIHSRAWIAALPRDGAGFFARLLNPLLRSIDVALAQKADLVFANSLFGQRYAEAVYRFPEGRVVPTYLGVDIERFYPAKAAPLRQIVSVCRLTAFKRVDVVLRAVQLLHDRGLRDLRLVVIGRGEAEDDLKKLAGELGLIESVDFRGAVSDHDLAEELRRSLALVLASVEEPFGLVAVEAMACGTPAIVTSTGGPAETVIDEESGFLIPPDDPIALADRVELLCRDGELLARLRRGAAERSRMFSWDETVALSRRHIEALVRRNCAIESNQTPPVVVPTGAV